jgi:hypothetical protein
MLALLAAMMLVASPVLAHPGGGTHGDKYAKNYYPEGYYNYCEPEGNNFYQDDQDYEKWCNQWYNGKTTTKEYNGKKYYYVHVYYEWYAKGQWYEKDYWYYCQYHKYNDPDSNYPYYKAWVGYPSADYWAWESFYWGSGSQQ